MRPCRLILESSADNDGGLGPLIFSKVFMSGLNIPDEMKIKYIERRKQDYDDCLKALVKNDFATFLRIGHQLKGNAASFGFDDLGLIAVEMEKAAHESDISKIKLSVDKLDDFLKKQSDHS